MRRACRTRDRGQAVHVVEGDATAAAVAGAERLGPGDEQVLVAHEIDDAEPRIVGRVQASGQRVERDALHLVGAELADGALVGLGIVVTLVDDAELVVLVVGDQVALLGSGVRVERRRIGRQRAGVCEIGQPGPCQGGDCGDPGAFRHHGVLPPAVCEGRQPRGSQPSPRQWPGVASRMKRKPRPRRFRTETCHVPMPAS